MAAAQTPSGNPQRTLTLAWATVWHAAVWCNSVAKPLAAPPNTSSGKALDYLVQQRKNVATSSFALTSRGFAIRHMTPHGCLILWRTVLHALVVPSLTAAISSIARHLTAQIQLGMHFGRTDHIQKVLVIALHIVVTSCSVAKLPVTTTPNSDLRLQARGKEVLQRFVANQSFARITPVKVPASALSRRKPSGAPTGNAALSESARTIPAALPRNGKRSQAWRNLKTVVNNHGWASVMKSVACQSSVRTSCAPLQSGSPGIGLRTTRR